MHGGLLEFLTDPDRQYKIMAHYPLSRWLPLPVTPATQVRLKKNDRLWVYLWPFSTTEEKKSGITCNQVISRRVSKKLLEIFRYQIHYLNLYDMCVSAYFSSDGRLSEYLPVMCRFAIMWTSRLWSVDNYNSVKVVNNINIRNIQKQHWNLALPF